MTIQPEPIGLPHFFTEAICQSIIEALLKAREAKTSNWFMRWDRETRFAAVVIIENGEPTLWRVIGPLSQEQVEQEMGLAKLATATPAGGTH